MTETQRWTPVLAIRGHAMLVDGKRIGMYAREKMIVRSSGKETHWGVMYLMLTREEWHILRPHLHLDWEPPYGVTYVSDSQPTPATISRAVISSLIEIESSDPWFIGWATEWGSEEIPHFRMQEMIIDMVDWIKIHVENSGV